MKRILYAQYTNPANYPPLEHSSRILANAGWQVLFLGTGAFGADMLGFPPHNQITVRRMRFCPAGWRQKLHYLQFCLWVLYWTLRWRPDWIYASDLFSTPIALFLSYLPRARVIYHEHDSPGASDSAFIRSCFATRKSLARRATLCVLPNEKRALLFTQQTGVRQTVVCVWNCPAIEEVAPPKLKHGDEVIRVLYHGSLGPTLLPPIVLNALALCAQVELNVIGYEVTGNRGYVQELKELACQFGVSERVRFLGAMSRETLMITARNYDVGLAIMPAHSGNPNLQMLVGASNKVFDYLACGLALLVSELPDWCSTFVEPGYGLACNPDDPESIAQALLWFLEHPSEMRNMGERGRQRIIAEWNYERQFEPVSNMLLNPDRVHSFERAA